MTGFQGGKIVRRAEVSADATTAKPREKEMGIRQLLDAKTGICTYLLWDMDTEDGLLLNPVDTERARDLMVTTSMNVVFAVNTHGLDRNHHISVATRWWKQQRPNLKVVLTKGTASSEDVDADLLLEKDDILLEDGDELHFGNRYITALSTASPLNPGKMSFLLDDQKAVLTASPLLSTRANGRIDTLALEYLYLWALPDDTIVFPGYCHEEEQAGDDAETPRRSTVGQEKKNNPLLSMKDELDKNDNKEAMPIFLRTRAKERWGVFG